jgi:hypothetical protein
MRASSAELKRGLVNTAPSNNLRVYGLLLLSYAVSRAVLYAAGLRFKLDLAWMFLADLPSLREHLLETVYYFHAFAPGMNLLTGVLLKLAPEHVAEGATLVFWAFGVLLLLSLFMLLEGLGVPRRASFAVALAFSLLPQTLYLENLYLYTYPCAALITAAAVAFQRALSSGKRRTWLSFFLLCSALGYLYTTFHLFWFCAMLGGSLAFAGRLQRRRVLRAAALPFALISALYLKNLAVFGVFGATSWAGANLTLVTTQIMQRDLRDRWIAEGKLSPFANLSAFALPRDYLPLLPKAERYPWPGSNELWRPSVDSGNYNHGLFLEVNRARAKDAFYFIRHRPGDYVRSIFERNLRDFLSATTHWHPGDLHPKAPHAEHRRVLGGYERVYDLVVHGFPAPVGLYVGLIPLWIWSLVRTIRVYRTGGAERRSEAATLGFCVFQIFFIASVSCLFSSLESARYRYTVEPFIWALAAVAVGALCSSIGARRTQRAS